MRSSIAVYDIAGAVPGATGLGSATFVAANRAIFQPFRVAEPCVIKQLYVHNGATASGNIDVGVYSMDGTQLVSTGSTAQSGTSNLQVFDVTDTLIGRGAYYVAVAMDNTTGLNNGYGTFTLKKRDGATTAITASIDQHGNRTITIVDLS
jgi:hypothetical protein